MNIILIIIFKKNIKIIIKLQKILVHIPLGHISYTDLIPSLQYITLFILETSNKNMIYFYYLIEIKLFKT